MAPPKKKCRLPVRVSRSSSDAKSSSNNKKQEKRAKKKPSKIPTAVLRSSSGSQSPSFNSESKRKNKNLQRADSELSSKADGHKNRENFFEKTIRKVLRSITPTRRKNTGACREETNSTNAAQSPSCNQPQCETANSKKLIPRDTKASVLRKQCHLDKQKTVSDNKKAKSAAKASSSASERRGLKYELKMKDGEVKTSAEFVDKVAGDQGDLWKSSMSLSTTIKKEVPLPPGTCLEDVSLKEEVVELCQSPYNSFGVRSAASVCTDEDQDFLLECLLSEVRDEGSEVQTRPNREGEKYKDTAPNILVASPDKQVGTNSSSESSTTSSSYFDEVSSSETTFWVSNTDDDTDHDISALSDLPFDDPIGEEAVMENCILTDDTVEADAVTSQRSCFTKEATLLRGICLSSNSCRDGVFELPPPLSSSSSNDLSSPSAFNMEAVDFENESRSGKTFSFKQALGIQELFETQVDFEKSVNEGFENPESAPVRSLELEGSGSYICGDPVPPSSSCNVGRDDSVGSGDTAGTADKERQRDDLEPPSKDVIKKKQIESEHSYNSYSDGSFEKASSSDEEPTPSLDSDMMSSVKEDSERVREADAGCLLLQWNDAGCSGTDSNVSEVEKILSQCESPMDFSADPVENKSAACLLEYRSERGQNEERSFVDGEVDSLHETLVGLSCQAPKSVMSKPMTEAKDRGSQEEIVEVFDEPNLSSVQDTSVGVSCKNMNSLKIKKEGANSAVNSTTDPELFHIPLSPKEIVRCDSKTEDNMTAERQVSEVVNNGNPNPPYAVVSADGGVEDPEAKTVRKNYRRLSQDPPNKEADLDAIECSERHQGLDRLPLNTQQLVPALSVSRVDRLPQDNPCKNADGAETLITGQEVTRPMEFELNSSDSLKVSDYTMWAAIDEPCRSIEATVHNPPNLDGCGEAELEEEALVAEVEELRKLRAKMDDLREALSGKRKPEAKMEKGVTEISGSCSRVMMLQSVKDIVCSIVQVSDDLYGGMRRVLEDSAQQMDALQREMIQMNEQHLQDLGERQDEIQSLAADNEQQKLQLEEMEEEKITIAYLIADVTMHNEEMGEAVTGLEEELKISQAESDKLKNEMEELKTQHLKEHTSRVQVFNEETSDVKSLKEEICSLQIQLQGSEEHRREKEALLESVSLKNETLSQRIYGLEEELTTSERQRNDLQMKMEAAQGEARVLRERQLGWLTDGLRKKIIHCEEAERALECAELEKQKLQEEIKVRRKGLSEYQTERQQLEIQIDQIKKEMQPFTTNDNHVVDDKAHLCGKADLWQGSVAQSELRKRETSCDDKLSEAPGQRMVDEKTNQLQKSLQDTQREIMDLKAWNVSLKNYYEGAKIVLKQKDIELQQAKNCVEETFTELESFKGLLMEKNAKIVALERKLDIDVIEMSEEKDAVKSFERKSSHSEEKLERERFEEERAELRTLLETKEKEIAELKTDVISYKNYFEGTKIALKQKDSELHHTKKYVAAKDSELKHVSDLLMQKDAKIIGLESNLEEKERQMSCEEEKSKSHREKLEAEKLDLRKALEDKERKIIELENYVSLKNYFEGAKISLGQKDIEAKKLKVCIDEKDEEVARAKLMLRRIEEERKQKLGCLEMFIALLKEDFERMCIFMPDKDEDLKKGGKSSDVKNREMEEVGASSPEDQSPKKEYSFSEDEEDDDKSRFKEANRFLKENIRRLEEIIRLQQTELQHWEDVAKMRDDDLTQKKEPLEDCRREMETVKCLLAVKEKEVAGLRKILSVKQKAANELNENFQRELKDLCLLRTELNYVKIENVKLGVKSWKMEKRVQDLEGMAGTESDFSLVDLRTALEHVRSREQNEEGSATVQGNEIKNVAHCTDDVTEELYGSTYKYKVPLNKISISSSC